MQTTHFGEVFQTGNTDSENGVHAPASDWRKSIKDPGGLQKELQQ